MPIRTDNTHWRDALEARWVDMERKFDGDSRAQLHNLFDQSRSFFHIGENLVDLVTDVVAAEANAEDWRPLLDAWFENSKSELLAQARENLQTGDGVTNTWQGLVDYWHEMSQIQENIPEPWAIYLDAVKSGVSYPKWADDFQWLRPDGWQRSIDLWTEFQRNQRALRLALAETGCRALDCLRRRLLNAAEQEKPVGSLRGLYDLWVECHEQSYREVVFTDEYGQIFSDLVNSAVAWKQHQDSILAEYLEIFMPQQKELRRTDQEQEDSAELIRSLRKEMQELRRKLSLDDDAGNDSGADEP